jgi:hypothetical protein
MKKYIQDNGAAAGYVVVALFLFNFFFVLRSPNLAYGAFSWLNLANAYTTELVDLDVYIGETYVHGFASTIDTPVTVILKDHNGVEKSMISTTTNKNNFFDGYFTQTVAGGDRIEVDFPNASTVFLTVPELTLDIDKRTDTLFGTARTDNFFVVSIYSYAQRSWYNADVFTGGSDDFSVGFGEDVDIFIGDVGKVNLHNSPDVLDTTIRNVQTPGFSANVRENIVSGYAAPGTSVSVTLRGVGGQVKGNYTIEANTSGCFSTTTQDIVAGDIVEVKLGNDPMRSITVVDGMIGAIDTDGNIVSGTAPANSKVEVYTYNGYTAVSGTGITNTPGTGSFTIDFSQIPANWGASAGISGSSMDSPQGSIAVGTSDEGPSWHHDGEVDPSEDRQDAIVLLDTPSFNAPPEIADISLDTTHFVDLLPGSSATMIYHDAQDNEIVTDLLYAGPYLDAQIGVNGIQAVGARNQAVEAVLRNAVGAIKGSAVGQTGDDAYTTLNFYDSAGEPVNLQENDQIVVSFSGAIPITLDVVDIDFLVNRDTGAVFGTVSPDAEVIVVADDGSKIQTTTSSASGSFQVYFDRLLGCDGVKVYLQNEAGHTISRRGFTPRFVVSPFDDRLTGVGPFDAPVVATLRDHNGEFKESVSTISSATGQYALTFSDDIVFGDIVSVWTGPFQFTQDVIPLTIAADTENEIVYGQAVPYGRLIVETRRDGMGPYTVYNTMNWLYAAGNGFYSASVPDVRGGDFLRVVYWNQGRYDQVEVYGYPPGLQIDNEADYVQGFTVPGETGTVALRDGGGTKASRNFTTGEVGLFYQFFDDGQMVTGDTISTNFPSLTRNSAVIPLQGTINLANNMITGTSLPNIEIGLELNKWTGDYYTSYYDGLLRRFYVTTNAQGNFTFDVGAHDSDFIMETGDFARLFYIDAEDTRYLGNMYTTSPTVTAAEYPTTAVHPNSIVQVSTIIDGGLQPESIYLLWDTESQGDRLDYRYDTGGPTSETENLLMFTAPRSSAVYFKLQAYVDGQYIYSDEYSIAVYPSAESTLYSPVSGTTNDNTPQIRGVTGAGAAVTLYRNNSPFMNTTADALGDFTFDITTPLAAGSHTFHAVATVAGANGPKSNNLYLTVDPTLPVDPVNILLDMGWGTQHLRDGNGRANLGGTVWGRAGEDLGIRIPISATDVYSASLYVGGLYHSDMLNGGDNLFVGTFGVPMSGGYRLDLKFRTGGASGPIETIQILNGLIDPDGYVYNASLGEEYRVAGATVICYEWVGGATGTWQGWNAKLWGQINPQVVAADGYYQFFTQPGQYKVVVTAPGFRDYESPVLTVVDAPVHHNVALRPDMRTYLPVIINR